MYCVLLRWNEIASVAFIASRSSVRAMFKTRPWRCAIIDASLYLVEVNEVNSWRAEMGKLIVVYWHPGPLPHNFAHARKASKYEWTIRQRINYDERLMTRSLDSQRAARQICFGGRRFWESFGRARITLCSVYYSTHCSDLFELRWYYYCVK